MASEEYNPILETAKFYHYNLNFRVFPLSGKHPCVYDKKGYPLPLYRFPGSCIEGIDWSLNKIHVHPVHGNLQITGLAVITGPSCKCPSYPSKYCMKPRKNGKTIIYEGGECGSGLTVFDGDLYNLEKKPQHKNKKCGVKSIKMLISEQFNIDDGNWYDLPFPMTQTRKTPLGCGYHLFFLFEALLVNGACQLKDIDCMCPLVDIRNTHGYIVLPVLGDKVEKYNEGRAWITPPEVDVKEYLIKKFKALASVQDAFPLLYEQSKKKGEIYNRTTRYVKIKDKKERKITKIFTSSCNADLEEVREVIDMYSQDSIDDREKWKITTMFLKRQFGDEALALYDHLCNNFSGAESEQDRYYQWETMPEDNSIPLGALEKIAKQDSPEEYKLYEKKKTEREETKIIQAIKEIEDKAQFDETFQKITILLGKDHFRKSLLFVNLIGDSLARCDTTWVYWDTNRLLWVRTKEDDEIASYLGGVIMELFEEFYKVAPQDSHKTLKKAEEKLQQQPSRISLVKDLKKEAKKYKNIYLLLDRAPDLFPLKNGNVIELRTGKVRKRVKEDYFTMETSHDYGDPNNEELIKYLTSLMPIKEHLDYLQVICGTFLTAVLVKLLFTFIGERDTGKSTFLGIVSLVLEGFYCAGYNEMIMRGPQKVAGSHDAELVPLITARLMTFSETNKNDFLNGKQVKKFIGGTPIPIRPPHGGKPESVPIYTKFIVETNNAPYYDYLEDSERNKMSYVKFSQRFERKEAQIIKNIKQRHLGNFLAWAAVGAKKFFDMQCILPKEPPDFELKKKEVVDALDSISSFLKEGDITVDKKDDSKHYGAAELFKVYKAFCVDAKYHPLNIQEFKADLLRKGFNQGSTGGKKIWKGIAPANDKETSND